MFSDGTPGPLSEVAPAVSLGLWCASAVAVLALGVSIYQEIRPGHRARAVGSLLVGVSGGIAASYLSPTSAVDARLAIFSLVAAMYLATLGHPLDLIDKQFPTVRSRSAEAGTLRDRKGYLMIIIALVSYFGLAWIFDI